MDLKSLSIDITGLTARKVTDKYISENFDLEQLSRKFSVKVETEQRTIPIEKLFMGQKLPIKVYTGIIDKILNGADNESIRTVRTAQGIFLSITTDTEEVVSEKDVSKALKAHIKTLIKDAKDTNA